MAPTSDVRDRWLDPEVQATALDPLRVHAKLPRCACQPQPLKRQGHSSPRRYAKAFRIASGLFPRGEIIVRTVTHRFALLLSFALAAGCASTKLVDSWAAPGIDASDLSFQHVVAIAAVPQVSRQRIAEDALEAAATETKVTAAYKIVSQEDRADTARLRTVLEENGIDGAIVVELIGVKDKETYVPPRATTIPSGYYGYWRRAGAVVYEPGYTRTDTYVRVKTSLFDVAGGKLLWSGESQTMNPTSVDKLIEEIVRAAGRDLKKRGLIQ